MNIDELTIGELKNLTKLIGGNTESSHPCQVGEKWLFRTVTHIDTGEVVAINGNFVTLKDAAWIADTGRYMDNLKSCSFNEVEPYPDICVVNLGGLIDSTPISKLPLEQK